MTNSPIDLSVSEILAILSVADTADAAAVAEGTKDIREAEAMLAAFETGMKKMRWVRAAVRANEKDQPRRKQGNVLGNAPRPGRRSNHESKSVARLYQLRIPARSRN